MEFEDALFDNIYFALIKQYANYYGNGRKKARYFKTEDSDLRDFMIKNIIQASRSAWGVIRDKFQ